MLRRWLTATLLACGAALLPACRGGPTPAPAPNAPPAPEPSAPWVDVRLVPTDARGVPLDGAQLDALHGRAELVRKGEGPPTAGVPVTGGTVRLRPGDYVFRVLVESSWRPVGDCTVAGRATELRLLVPDAGPAVRLVLRGIDGPGYELRIVHESGRTVHESGRPDRTHTLMLPPGPCVATLTRALPGRPRATAEHVFTVTEDSGQEIVWQVPAAR